MSSHHFVKEGQEPPLVAFDWSDKLRQIAQELLEWQPKFVVSAQVIDAVVMDGFKPDAVLDFNGEPPSFLHPIESLVSESFLNSIEAASMLFLKEDWDNFSSILSNQKIIIYTEKYKIFKVNRSYKKILPQGSKLFTLDAESKRLTERLADTNQRILLDDFITKIIVEEL